MKPRLLDLFCGAGGAAAGYARAGFDVTGVDSDPAAGRYYPFKFHAGQWDAIDPAGYDAIHASPPCQAYSITRHAHDAQHPELVEPVREWLRAAGRPYVIENVPGAPLLDPLMLCGTMFNLTAIDDKDGARLYLRRHRLFESNVMMMAPDLCRCTIYRDRGLEVGGVYGGASADKRYAREVRHGGYTPSAAVARELMGGVDWMSHRRLAQAIPPAYTEWIGGYLLEAVAVDSRG